MVTYLHRPAYSLLLIALLALLFLVLPGVPVGSEAQTASKAIPDELMRAVLVATGEQDIYREQKVTASDGEADDYFGYSVALSGDTALVGVYLDDVGTQIDQGSAYVFIRDGTVWNLQQKLAAGDGEGDDFFGYSVALSGDTALVGAYGDNDNQGSAYVFARSGTTWSQGDHLTAPDGEGDDYFGYSVALLGDTALVGAPQDDVGANNDEGSAYVFARIDTDWDIQAQLFATDGTAEDRFGSSVALSGETALVGAPGANVGTVYRLGAAYVFTRSGTSWSEEARLTAWDGAHEDSFGASVALSGDTALVGAFGDDVEDVITRQDQGSAYIYTRSGTAWSLQQKLTASDGWSMHRFGNAVALSADTALVGAPWFEYPPYDKQGAAYVFTRSGSTWSQEDQLIALDTADDDLFGISVALSGDTALVGAYGNTVGWNVNQGSAYVWTRSVTSWSEEAQLTASGEAGDEFGVSVALSGDTALVGAPFADVGDNADQGSVYVLIRDGWTWRLLQKLTVQDGEAEDYFGWSVALSGDTALIGAYGDDVGAHDDQGSAYVWIRVGSSWWPQEQLTAGDGEESDYFGWSVALSGDTALVGALYDDVGASTAQGSAYVYTRSADAWSEQDQLTATDGELLDWFGFSVALEGDTALVGAPWDDYSGKTNQGTAYVFTRNGEIWSQEAHLAASDGEDNDSFGYSVALSGDTALVGSPFDTIGIYGGVGSAYVFTVSGTTWTQQDQLSRSGGGADDHFGLAVALLGDTALVGASGDDVGLNDDQGSATLFSRSGTSWSQGGQLFASDGAAGDEYGGAVALAADTILVGAYIDDIGANIDQGSAYFYQKVFKVFLPLAVR